MTGSLIASLHHQLPAIPAQVSAGTLLLLQVEAGLWEAGMHEGW